MCGVATKWEALQIKIAECTACLDRWKGQVANPLQLGEIPAPSGRIKILFVGVAPTPLKGKNQGAHFYTSRGDSLRIGLFKVLDDLLERNFVETNRRSKDAAEAAFHAAGFFFVHGAKVRPVKKSAPPRKAIRFCARQHLLEEIQLLQPEAVCFLGANNAAPAGESVFDQPLTGVPVMCHIGGWAGWVVLAPQPIRAGKALAPTVIERLLKKLRGAQSPTTRKGTSSGCE